MLRHLVEKPRDFVGSFKRLPVRLQELFVQAYQSYLFNRFLSGRIRNGFSLNTAEVGDYVVSVERSGLPMIKTGKLVSAGNLAKTNRMIEAKRMRVALPLVGVRQGLSQGASGEIERQILEAEAAKPADFRVDAIPEMSGRGELRAIISPVRDFRVDEISSATKNSSEYEVGLRFMLLRGSYATVVLREIMKPRDPIAAGF
jgi:tRNA pseudouridine13 synthase